MTQQTLMDAFRRVRELDAQRASRSGDHSTSDEEDIRPKKRCNLVGGQTKRTIGACPFTHTACDREDVYAFAKVKYNYRTIS